MGNNIQIIEDLEQLRPFLNKKHLMEIIERGKDGRIMAVKKVALADLPQGEAKEMVDKAIKMLNKNNSLLNKNMDLVRQVANIQKLGVVLNGLNLCATCVGFAIMYEKLDKMSAEIMQGFKRLEEQGKLVVDANTNYELSKILSDHQDMLDCRKKQKPYSEEKMRLLVDQEYNILSHMIEVLQSNLSVNKERMITSIFSMLAMFTASLRFFDEQYYFENRDVLGNDNPWHSSHDKWMSIYDVLTANEFVELLQDYAMFDTSLNTLGIDVYCVTLVDQAKTLKQEVNDNQTLITEIGDIELLSLMREYTNQQVKNELENAFKTVFEGNDNPEIQKVCEEAKNCIALA